MMGNHRPRTIRRLRSLTVFALLSACGAGAETPDTEPPPVTVGPEYVAVADTMQLSSGPSISGALAPRRQATLRAELGGLVTETRVDPGQAVAAGAVLVTLDDSAIRDAALSARAGVRTAREALVVATRNAERAEKLTQAGAMAERDLESARWQVTNAEGTLSDAEARAALAEKQLEKTVLRAPFAGVVSERPANPGDVVQMGTALVTLVDPASLRLEATVPAEALEALRVGTVVDFRVTGLEHTFAGKIERINPTVDPATRQVRLLVTLPNHEGRLVAGLFAQGRVATARREVLAIPMGALDQRGPTPTVRRLRSGRVEEVAVDLGMRDEVRDQIEVVKGLAAGDTVLIGQAQGIAVGTLVRLKRE